MIKNKKKLISKIIMKCILGLIIISFIFSTVQNYIPRNKDKNIVKINGEMINLTTLKNNFLISLEEQKRILGQDFLKMKNNKNFIKKIYHYTLNQLINTILLEQYAQKLKLVVSDQEIKDIIFQEKLFQINNVFNKEKYFDYISSISLNNEQYINIIKKKIITQKILNTILYTNFILNSEKEKIIKLLSEKRMIKIAIIKKKHIIEKQKISNQEIYNYFNNHRNQFYTPRQFKISYIKIKKNYLLTKKYTKNSKKWYKNYIIQDNNIKKKYSVIQVNNKKTASLILYQLNKYENIYNTSLNQFINSASFTHTRDMKLLSTLDVNNAIKKAKLIKKGEISNIIPVKNTFLIIKLSDIQNEENKTLSEKYDFIKKALQKKQELIQYNFLKKKINDCISQRPNQFNYILKKINIKPLETNWLNIHNIPKNLNSPIIKKFILKNLSSTQKNSLQKHSGWIELNHNVSLIISIKNVKNKEYKKIEDVKKNIIYLLKKKKAKKNYKKYAENIIVELKKEKKELFNKIFFDKFHIISRYNDDPITPIIFSLPHPYKNKKVYSYFQNKNGDIQIIFLKKVYYSKFSKEEYDIINTYLENNNNEKIFNIFTNILRKKAHIIYM